MGSALNIEIKIGGAASNGVSDFPLQELYNIIFKKVNLWIRFM